MPTASFLSPSDAMMQIGAHMQRGDVAGARAIADAARRNHPREAAIADAAGDLALKSGDVEAAITHFAAASQLAPKSVDYALNHAIALQRTGRHAEAIAAIAPYEAAGRSIARYGSVRALSHRSLGEPTEAARWYDATLQVDPRHLRAHHGRARIALERGESDALARYDKALSINSGDAELWLGKAQALEFEGDVAGARVIARQLCDQAPGFIAALEYLTGLNLAAGKSDFTSPFKQAEQKVPQDPNIAAAHVETLAGLDYADEACEVAAEARERFPSEPHFALLEAVHAGSAGQWERAEAIFTSLTVDTPLRALHEARHAIRARDPERAEQLLERALSENPWDISAWALRGIAWRLTDDPRAEWLHQQAGLVQLRPLIARDGLVDEAIETLRALHAKSAMPLGQSLRGGTQTRGILFHRTEPVFSELHGAIRETLEAYRANQPELDLSHPLLRHHETPWQLLGSWSVRLSGNPNESSAPNRGEAGDYHTAHIHPQGIVSSALYLVVPPESEDEERRCGWLEIGRPPPDLGLDLEPVHTIRPKPAHLALFPSTLYHGTTPFDAEERMTVAFDVITDLKAGRT